MIDPNKLVEDVRGTLDDSITSKEEYNQQSTDRLTVDTTSPFKLPHLIRPILGIWVAALFTIIVTVGLFTGQLTFAEALQATEVLVGGVFIFYFGSRGFEKVAEQRGKAQVKVAMETAKAEVAKAEAAIEIEKIRTKADIKEDRKEARAERRQTRRDDRN